MGPTAGSSSSSSSKPTASSSRAVKIPHRSTVVEEQTAAHDHSARAREIHRKFARRPDALVEHGDSSDSSSPPHSAPRSALPNARAGTSSSSSYSSSFEPSLYDPASTASTSKLKAKSTTAGPPTKTLNPPHPSPLGPSMASSTSYRSINLNSDFGGDPGSPPHLITYTKTGQGFTWNEELFLPSYMMGRYEAGGSRRRRRRYEDEDMPAGDEEAVEIAEIFISDEEARDMMP